MDEGKAKEQLVSQVQVCQNRKPNFLVRSKLVCHIMLSIVVILLIALGWYVVVRQTQVLTQTTIMAYQQTELEVVRAVARSVEQYVHNQTEAYGRTDVAEFEQEIFEQFVAPIRLLEHGDAWIYAPDHVVFDLSADFPDEYRSKSMAEIFAIQSQVGASHYEEMTDAVMNAREGVGWYVWLPDKGKEIAAWTPVRVGEYVWTIGLSTPLPDILAATGATEQMQALTVMMGLGIFILLVLLFAWGHSMIQCQRVDEALWESEVKHRLLLNSIQTPVVALTENLTIIYCNDTYAEFVGKPVVELEGKSLLALFPEVRQTKLFATYLQALETGQMQEVESQLGTRYLRDRVYCTPWGILSIAEDISERKRAEDALQESEEKLRVIFRETLDIIMIIDGESGQVLSVNRATRHILGYEEEALIGKHFSILFPPEPDLSREDLLGKLRVYGVVFESQEFLRADGSVCPMDLTATLIPWGKGKAILTTLRDVTERRRAEQALARRNRELALLNRAGQALSATLDLDQVLTTVLEEVRRLLDVVACSVWLVEPSSLVPTGDGQSGDLVCRHAIGTKGEFVRGWRLAPGEGFIGWVARSGESLIVPDAQADDRYFGGVDRETGLALRSILSVPLHVKQKVIGVLQVMDTDVDRFGPADLALVEPLAASASIAIENARLHQEVLDHAEQLEQRVQERTAQLATQYARLEAILSSTADGIIVADEYGEILQVNPVAEAWLTRTLSPEDAAWLREAVQDLARRAEERQETVLELTGLDLELKAASISEPGMEEALRPDFGEFGRAGSGEPSRTARSEPAVVVAVHDVSELKALDRMKSRFVENVAHELRTPATTIKLYAYLMRQKPERWERYLHPLVQEADRQARLVQDILHISRIDAGRLEMKPRPTSLNELTNAAIVGHQALAHDRGLTLEHRPAEAELVALVDPERMMQVLNNLVGNAISYTPEGGSVVVSVGKEEAKGRVWATVTVTDTGMGISEEELPYVFDRFFRGEEPRMMQISGTGLGLAIVKEIVELHGGRVTVESRVGEGTYFTVWLPPADAGA